MAEKERQSDIVEEAFESLRRPPLPQGPSSQALERALQAVRQAREKSDRISIIERIRTMNRLIKYPVAASIALAVLAGAACLLLGPHAGIAFADVRQQIERTNTMTLTAVAEMKAGERRFTTKMKMYFKSPGLMRQEVAVEGNVPAMPGTRQTTTAPAQRTVSILDIPNQKGITLIPDQKKAMVYEFKSVPPEMFARAKQQFLLDELKKAVSGEHEELGAKTIDGRKAQGYRVTSKMGQMTITMELWADASTGKPMLIEQALPEGLGKVTMTDFVLNPVLDDSLFDTKVPDGYSVEKQTLDFSVREPDLTKGLGLLAKHCGGEFPKNLLPTPEVIQRIDKSAMLQEERIALRSFLANAVAYQVALTQTGGEFVYAGEGVKLGDKTTPVLWYKAKDAKAYRVIYGDLHVEDAEAAPKSPASEPTTKPR